ncbi:HPr-rel-A system PqqD family peptide chaperone [Sphingomonas sp. R647]|uniref:HPr-rel-A system PqqD family peptide chaperone n=1 Tax=Sphingomonas sp. R647 TaxID=2875233 RepID=UPI001CD5AA90|nr:HPr-rel-A system PqqD family peptide chaperone [Sphingomonas sp. R647]MCA1196534.1 HPr-rel-A system PqqD family peptide chaperone [Sphingomonas sp. R647]
MIRPALELYWPPVPGELAIYDTRDGRYHVLNPSAAVIWSAIAAETPVARIAADLAARFGIAVDVMQADVDAFVANALQLGLLVDA